jgi:hypothetical protein
MKCEECDKESTFISPRSLCDNHWAEWWADGVGETRLEKRV